MVSQAAHPTAIALISAQEERIRTPSQAAPSCATIAGRSTRPSGVVPPNQRMQPDAAARPQDRCDFGSCISKTAIPIYWCGAADAPGVRPLLISASNACLEFPEHQFCQIKIFTPLIHIQIRT
jgi:hypothetical protein